MHPSGRKYRFFLRKSVNFYNTPLLLTVKNQVCVNLEIISPLLYAEKIAECKPQRIKKHRSDTDLLYLLGAEIAILFSCTVPQKSCYGSFRLRRLID